MHKARTPKQQRTSGEAAMNESRENHSSETDYELDEESTARLIEFFMILDEWDRGLKSR